MKRSFIRKKIVRRNYSVSSARSGSKSKDGSVKVLVQKGLHEYSDRSIEKRQKMKEKEKKEAILESHPRISEVSEENR